MNDQKRAFLKILNDEKQLVKNMFTKRDYVVGKIIHDPQVELLKYLKLLRKSEYYHKIYKTSSIKVVKYYSAFIFLIYKLKKNCLGNKLNVDIRENTLGASAQLFHPGIVINGNAKIGKNCRLHGNNCIGNSGKSPGVPVIGDNVDIGYGASVIGEVKVTDNVTLGAGTIVVKSINEPGIYVGIPAKRL